jgi:dephospho-CoA kinase
MKIVGVSGTNGSGKDTIGHLLAERHGYLFISMTDMLRDELTRRGLPPAREHMRNLSAEWRRESGLGVLIDKSLEVFKKQPEGKYKGLVVASLRNPGETDRLHELGGTLVWVDADPKTRYDRLQAHAQERGALRAVDDQKTFDQFLAEEQVEMQHSGDSATLNMSAVKKGADIFLANNGNDIEAFKDEAEKALEPYTR